MSQDIVADALNMIRNSKKARKEIVKINRISNLLIEILKIMKQEGAIKKYKINSKEKYIEITNEKIPIKNGINSNSIDKTVNLTESWVKPSVKMNAAIDTINIIQQLLLTESIKGFFDLIQVKYFT